MITILGSVCIILIAIITLLIIIMKRFSPYAYRWKNDELFGEHLCSAMFSTTKNGKISVLFTTSNSEYSLQVLDKHNKEIIPGDSLFEYDCIYNDLDEFLEALQGFIDGNPSKPQRLKDIEWDDVNTSNHLAINMLRGYATFSIIKNGETEKIKYINKDQIVEEVKNVLSKSYFKAHEKKVGFDVQK